MAKILDIANRKYGRLLAIKFVGVNKYQQAIWKAICDCGNIVNVLSNSLNSNTTTSCGCLKNELVIKMGKNNTTHGMRKTRLYRIWAHMMNRCYNPNNKKYFNYGGRGITVCLRWHTFENFRDDMYALYLKHIEEFGEKETTLDRVEVMGNYESSNCKWSTNQEQAVNRTSTPKTDNFKVHSYYRTFMIKFLSTYIKRNVNSSLFKERFGCTLPEFKDYIAYKFLPGMTWENHGNGKGKWNFDHIIPVNTFDLSKEEDRKTCYIYTNYQPLWYVDNMTKSRGRQLYVIA